MAAGAVGCTRESSTSESVASLASTAAGDETEQATQTDSAAEPTIVSTPVTTEAGNVSLQTSSLTDDELAGLLWMREEEQLAHDVYMTLHEQWGLRIFENIAGSESTHIEAALGVLADFGIADPAAGNDPGEFTEPQIQALYDRLVEQGSGSLEDALEVGAFIEELDIDDLRIRAAATDTLALTDLYARLEQGSRNHLRAFTSQLERRDVSYEPTQLDADAYAEIVSSPMERGHDA
jgi:hypothetical protein